MKAKAAARFAKGRGRTATVSRNYLRLHDRVVSAGIFENRATFSMDAWI